MQRVAGTDALFFSAETTTSLQHVGTVVVLDPGSDSFSYRRLIDTLEDRLRFVPKFRYRVREVPFGLARPVWVEDKDFDIHRQIRRIGLPSPGGRAELGEIVGQLHAQPLNRRCPLWELWFIEGLAGGRVAFYLKMHHSLMDGMSGMSLLETLYDPEPDPSGPYQPLFPPEEKDPPGTKDPSDLALLVGSVPDLAGAPVRTVRYAGEWVRRGLRVVRRGGAGSQLAHVRGPDSSLNGVVGPRRWLATASVSFDDLRRLSKTLEVTINDAVMALVTGTLRAYLTSTDELPDSPMTAMMNFSLRSLGEGHDDSANAVATSRVEAPVQLADPVERVRIIGQSTLAAKRAVATMEAKSIQSIGVVAPPMLMHLVMALALSETVASKLPRFASVTVSNLPGPPVPLYVAGARVCSIYPASIIMGNAGVNVTGLSYAGRFDMGFTIDPDLVEFPDRLAAQVGGALQELLDAAGLGEATPVEDPLAG